jgi:hypothetical protein
MTASDPSKLDRIVAEARRNVEKREQSYREQAFKIYPWICGRCGREFTHANLRELTVHHRDHNHDNNPADGSNWELLCLYCHDNEHQRQLKQPAAAATPETIVGKRPIRRSRISSLCWPRRRTPELRTEYPVLRIPLQRPTSPLAAYSAQSPFGKGRIEPTPINWRYRPKSSRRE